MMSGGACLAVALAAAVVCSRCEGLVAPRRREVAALKGEIFDVVGRYGCPATALTAADFAKVDASCARLEALQDGPHRIGGRWRVAYSNAPPPSNGFLGPIRGEALQVVDEATWTYRNELRALGGALFVALEASYIPQGADDTLRVTFETLQVRVFGAALPLVRFPPGVDRTWCLGFTDVDTRILRAGVDGGRSLARDAGLLDKTEGEAPDAFLFVLQRENNQGHPW